MEGWASRAADDGPHHSETAPDMLDADAVVADSDTNHPAMAATAADTAHHHHSRAPCDAALVAMVDHTTLFLVGPSCMCSV